MYRLRSLWFAAVALVVTALFMLAAIAFMTSAVAEGAALGHLSGDELFWGGLAILVGSLLSMHAALRRTRVKRAPDWAPRPRGPVLALAPLVMGATSPLWFAASAYFAVTPQLLPDLAGAKRWALVLCLAAAGATFLRAGVVVYQTLTKRNPLPLIT